MSQQGMITTSSKCISQSDFLQYQFSYTELWLEQPFRHFDLAARIARKSFDRYDFLSHNDYLISVSKQILGATLALSYRDSDAKEEYFSVQGNYLGGQIIALTLSKNIEVSSF